MSPLRDMDLAPHIESLLRDLRARLEALYGDRLHAVVLYGSYARGEESPESDVDVMVVLEGEVDPWREIRRMSDAAYEVSSAHEELVSVYPVSHAEFETSRENVISVARDEGVHG